MHGRSNSIGVCWQSSLHVQCWWHWLQLSREQAQCIVCVLSTTSHSFWGADGVCAIPPHLPQAFTSMLKQAYTTDAVQDNCTHKTGRADAVWCQQHTYRMAASRGRRTCPATHSCRQSSSSRSSTCCASNHQHKTRRDTRRPCGRGEHCLVHVACSNMLRKCYTRCWPACATICAATRRCCQADNSCDTTFVDAGDVSQCIAPNDAFHISRMLAELAAAAVGVSRKGSRGKNSQPRPRDAPNGAQRQLHTRR